MSRDMVDSHPSRREHGKKRHHHHHRTITIDDSDTDTYTSRASKRTNDYSPSSDRAENHRSCHHKSKKHKHVRDDSRSKHRSSPKESKTEKYQKIRIKEEPVSPKLNEETSRTRLSKEDSSSKKRKNDGSPDPELPRRNERTHHSSDSNSRETSGNERRREGARSNQGPKKGKSKFGAFSPSAATDDKFEWGKKTEEEGNKTPVDKQKPNFGLSGKLTEDTNMYNGVVIKYSEPPEARKPKRRWRLYPFKGDEALPMMHIHRQSAFLMGRDRKVVDIPIDHPSCSKQHAALQYRLVPYQRDDGSTGKRIRLYVIDLESANGTYVNNNKIEARKYVELMERDVIKFGYSSREYVLLHEGSKDDEDDE